MPGPAAHFLMALGVLERWRNNATAAPFPPNDPVCRNALLCGALAPDMGYFPGGEPFATDLAHYVHSSTLVRNLIAGAQSDRQRAFAWGWATHVLGDILGHPLVNRGAGELVHGDRLRPLSYADDLVTHVRVEMGLDAWFVATLPPDVRLRPALDIADGEYLVSAYRQTYGYGPDAGRLLAAHTATVRCSGWVLLLDRVQGVIRSDSRPRLRERLFDWLVVRPVRGCTGYFGRRSAIYALTHITVPPPWLIEEFSDLLRRYSTCFLEHAATELRQLANHNLDLGVVEDQALGYPPAERTRRLLEKRRRRGP